MDFAADLSFFFSDFADAIVIDGITVNALIDTELAEVFAMVGGVSSTIRVPAGTLVHKGSSVAARGKTYIVARAPYEDFDILILGLAES